MFVNVRAGLALLAVGLALTATGCGKGETLTRVTGKVSYEGQPISEGRILFRNTGGDQRAYSAAITNGAYELMCEPGTMRVEIIASRVIPGKFKKGENGEKELIPEAEMYIPTKYNSESKLSAEVKSSANDVPFDLTK